MELECLLVADDLTGACDAAVHFAALGAASVQLEPGLPATGVLAISTDTRDLPPAGIRRAMTRAAATGISAGRIFKKIDSTLRGNAGAEIAAALEAFGCAAAVVCPALPKLQRVVRQGLLCVTCAPDFAPIDVAAQLRAQSGCTCVHTAPESVVAALADGVRLVSAEAVTDEDLDRLADVLFPLGRRVLWVGSAGLASALGRRLGAVRGLLGGLDNVCSQVRASLGCAGSQPSRGLATCPTGDTPQDLLQQEKETADTRRMGGRQSNLPAQLGALFCIGSDHPVTLGQQGALIDKRSALLFRPEDAAHDLIRGALAAGRHAILRIPRGRISVDRVRELVDGVSPAALVLSGGDTASLVCRACEVRSIELCDEIVAGVPRGILRGGPFDGVAVATKSGGFGDSDTLLQVADYFTCPK